MAPLPQIQLALPLQLFSRCAVDFGGPFLTKQGRGKKTVFVFVYMPSFLCSTPRKGLPVEMLSDNDTNFVGGEHELRALIEKSDAEKIVSPGADTGIKWNFNPPLALHFEGVHESMIKSVKKAIKAIAGNPDVNDEELMNSWPLKYQTSNPEDETP